MNERPERSLIIKEIEPTVFFVEQNGVLKEGIDILIENKGNPTKVSMEISFGRQKENINIENVEKGEKSYRIYIPEIQERINAEFVLFAKGKVHNKKTIELTPQKHWQVYVVHSSHHDLGYTDLPSNVFLEHDSYLDDVLRFCEETENWPEETKFKYSVEQFWSAAPFHTISFREAHIFSLLKRLDVKGYQFDIVRTLFLGGDKDNSPPSIGLSYLVRDWNSKYVYPEFIVGTNDMFFKHLEKECGKVKLPVFKGELPNTDYTIGAISSARETSLNRITHDQLLSAEKFSFIASCLSDFVYPSKVIKDAYENMFLYDLHCWGVGDPVGPAQDAVWSDKINFAYKASALTHDVLTKSINKIADKVKLDDDGWYVLAFNPLSWKRNEIVSVPLRDFLPCSTALG